MPAGAVKSEYARDGRLDKKTLDLVTILYAERAAGKENRGYLDGSDMAKKLDISEKELVGHLRQIDKYIETFSGNDYSVDDICCVSIRMKKEYADDLSKTVGRTVTSYLKDKSA